MPAANHRPHATSCCSFATPPICQFESVVLTTCAQLIWYLADVGLDVLIKPFLLHEVSGTVVE